MSTDTTPIELRKEASVMELATMVAESRTFPECRSPAAAAVRILAGREMGVPPITAVGGIRVTNGRISMDGCLMAGMIERSGGRYDFAKVEHTAEKCVLEFYRDGKPRGRSEFGIADAKRAGLLTKGGCCVTYPSNMLFWRALSNGAKQYCAGLFGGSVYVHEELGLAMDADGNAIGGNGDGDTAGAGTYSTAGADLCTREQRQEIARLVEAAGKSMPGFLAELGIRLLDELSGYEAERETKKLRKAVEKREKAATKAAGPVGSEPATQTPGPARTSEDAPAPVPAETLGPAQQMIADAKAEAALPSTPQQRQRILDLAERMEKTASEQIELVKHLLRKYGHQRPGEEKIARLTHLGAAAIIETMERALGEPPFDTAGTSPAK